MTKRIILTGGHTGIGLELTKMLLKDGHKLGLILRDETRKKQLADELSIDGIDFFYADLSIQNDVVSVAKQIAEQWDSVDILYNNAGVLLDDVYLSKQGNEMHFEVNTLAAWLLSQTLVSELRKKSGQECRITIINTVTDFLYKQKKFLSQPLLAPTKNKKLFGAYLQSKLALVLLMNNWGRHNKNLHILNVTPGATKTKMTAGSGLPLWVVPLRGLLFAKPSKGAKFLYDAAFKGSFDQLSNIIIQNNKVHYLHVEIDEDTEQQLLKRVIPNN